MFRKYLKAIDASCEQFKNNVDDVATFYLAADASAKLLASFELTSSLIWEMHMSDNFPKEATTTRNAEEVLTLYRQGTYERLNSYQTVIGLCSMFEVFVASLAEMLDICGKDSISIVSWRRGRHPLKIKNKTLCLVRAIHEALGIESQLGEDSALCWIYNFILLRNVVVHEGGVLKKEVRERLVAKWSKHPVDKHLSISGNDIDDMVCFLKSHIAAFAYQTHKKCEGP